MLRGIFGEPQIWSDKNMSGGQHGVYGWTNTGCVIQYLEDDNQTTIIVLKKPKGAKPSRSIWHYAPKLSRRTFAS